MLRICSLLVLALLAQPAAAEALRGRGKAVDGDTLTLRGQTLRLYGIDAPERGQGCTRADGRGWDCGGWARDRLAALLAEGPIACTARERDRYGRIVARCEGPRGDIAAALVAEGAAFAYRRYAQDYVDAEKRAAIAGIGLWQGEAERPDLHRATTAPPPQAPPGRCAIKGNISANGRIYHLPGSRSYDETRIDTRRGERWFCSEAEARAAGWRRAGG